MTQIWDDFTDYISQNYPDAKKIVEVGVGAILTPAQLLKEKLPNTKITLIDIHPKNETVIYDDITQPTDSIYENSDLIYAIRPPEELQPDIMNLASKYNTDIIIKPLFTEEINLKYKNKLKLKNYKRLSLYHYKRVI